MEIGDKVNPYAQMDLALWTLNDGRPAAELAAALGITETQAQCAYIDIEAKLRTTHDLHQESVPVEPVSEIFW